MTKPATPLLSVRDLQVYFPVKAAHSWPWQAPLTLKAVDGVSFELYAGETLGIVGESGCGKSTLARAVVHLHPATHGSITWQGHSISPTDSASWRAMRRDVQMIFQDPLACLNPRMTVAQIIAEPLQTHHPEMTREAMHNQVLAMMSRVGLAEHMINRYPHEFSGGQCQRIGIARALMLRPKLIICDEPVSALDVSIQAQIINLLKELQKEMGLALIFIAHDLAVVRHISHRVMVMYLGRVVEMAQKATLYQDPEHPYTQALLAAIPIPDPDLERNKPVQLISSDLPSPLNPPRGCAFVTRCPRAVRRCEEAQPQLSNTAVGSVAACFFTRQP